MKRILLVGYDPATVDFSDPALPPGMTAEKVHAGLAVAMKGFCLRMVVIFVRYFAFTMPGGFQVPSPRGRTDGASVFGQ